jgi:DNA excision repair protein ERCC-2
VRVLRFDDSERTLQLSIHDVLDAGPPSGDLHLGGGWSGVMRMRAGVEVHATYQQSQMQADPAYAKEVRIAHRLVVRDWEVTIQGRMDGLVQEGDFWVVEEVKSSAFDGIRLDQLTLGDMPRAVLQLRLYLHVLGCRGQDAVGRLVIVSLVDGSQRVLHVEPDPSMGAFLAAQLEEILIRRESRVAWQARRQSAVVPMPHEQWREGQEAMAEDVAAALHRNHHVLLTAPTGIGKTAAVLTGALRVAAATDKRIFFATARTTQQLMVERTLRGFAQAGFPIHAVSIRARDKVCLNDVVACRPDCCAFAKGHHDRVRDGDLHSKLWREQSGVWTIPHPDEVVELSQTHQVCPFALTMELVKNADVVVGDYNYVFDPSRRLGPVAESPDEWILIVDEAHNLPDRAMGYASPVLDRDAIAIGLDALSRHPAYRACADLMQDVLRFVDAGIADLVAGEEARTLDDGIDATWLIDLARRFDELAPDYALLRWEQPVFSPVADRWIDVARAVHSVRETVHRAGAETVVIWRSGRRAGMQVLCRDASMLLGPVFNEVSATVAMSATLMPATFYQSMFGQSEARTEALDYPSPFDSENRRVLVVPTVSTEYRHRERDRDAIGALVSEAIGAVPGNVAVFFSSFALRDSVLPEIELGHRPLLVQERNMDEAARHTMLQTMAAGEGHVLLCVLGGIFAEGIDLPGDALLAAIVVGPALPPVGLERRLLSAWFDERYGHGFRYAYLVPGMARVVQAAGRVIRTPSDRGAIVLIGRRFLQRSYQAFFPPEWEAQRANDPAIALDGHWSEDGSVTEAGCGR